MSKPTDALSKVLSYVDSPFKLFALLLMAVFAFSGYFVLQNQAFLFEAYKENKKLPMIAEDRAEDVAAHLFKIQMQLLSLFLKLTRYLAQGFCIGHIPAKGATKRMMV